MQVLWFGAQSVSHPELLKCSLQIMGREEVAGKNKEVISYILLDSTRILGPSPMDRTQAFCKLAKTVEEHPLGERALSQVA